MKDQLHTCSVQVCQDADWQLDNALVTCRFPEEPAFLAGRPTRAPSLWDDYAVFSAEEWDGRNLD